MEALNAGCSRVEHQHISSDIPHHFQYMGMAADKDVRLIFIDQLTGPDIISSRVASDMGHQHSGTTALEAPVKRMSIAEVVIVAVTCNADKRLISSNVFSQLQAAAEIAGMPDLIDRREKITELLREYSMCV